MVATKDRIQARVTRTMALARRSGLAIAIGAGSVWISLAWPIDASAQRSGEAWDDSHMQSNSARRFDPSPPRPPIRGTNRFEQSVSNPTKAPPTTVPETTLHISQHEWAPGGPSGSSTGASRPSSSSGGSSFGGISGGAAPSVSSGISRSSSGGRSSSLRSTSSGSERGRRR